MYTFIVNPNARSGLGKSVWKQVQDTLDRRHVDYEVYFTEYQRHATALVHKITSDNAEHTVIALGGDGTVNEIVNGIVNYSKVTFGYIPIGSSNDFARGYGLPTDPIAALNNILSPSRIHLMDIGITEYGTHQKKFAVSTGIGYDAAICHQAMVSKVKVFLNKLKLGKLTYGVIAMHRMILDRPVTVTLTMDGNTPITFEQTFFTTVMNLPYEGGGFKFCPKARPDDGELNVFIVNKIPKPVMLLLFPFAAAGFHTRFPGIHMFRCKEVSIETNKALPVHTDGEPIFLQKRMLVHCADRQLKIIGV